MRAYALGLLLLFLLGSGCLGWGGGGESLATEFSVLREKAVPEGLLVPSAPSERDAYRQSLVSFRSRVNALSVEEKTTLNAYLDGSLSLLDMVSSTDEALSLLENVNLDFFECGSNTPASKAIESMEDARESAQVAHTHFQTVQQNPTLTNALGADYVLNATQTTSAIVTVHAERVKELKTACGFSV